MSNENAEATVQRIIETPTEDLMDISFQCVCGKTHDIPMKYLSNSVGAIDEVGPKLKEFGMTGKGALVFDRKIQEKVVHAVQERLMAQGLDFDTYPVGDGIEKIPPEIEWSQALAERIRDRASFLISVGSGVVSDLTKYAGSLLNLPYVLIATAPSMNGYTSSMAALTDKGIKKTLLIQPARGIFSDIALLQKAPPPMVQAGLGDIVSKSVCNADWKLSQFVKHTYFCPLSFRITDKSEPLYLEAAEEIRKQSEQGIRILSDGVLRSGLSMTVIGTSTPSSGAEHVLSHYIDLLALMEGREKQLHGVQVGVMTLITLRLYSYVREYQVKNIDLQRMQSSYPSKQEISAMLHRKFGAYAGEVEKEYFSKFMEWDSKQQEIEGIIDQWDALWDELNPYLRPIEPVEEALVKSGSASTYEDLGMSRNDALDMLINARYIRGRYTILDLAHDLGILEEAAERIL